MADHSPPPPPDIDALIAAIRGGHLDDELPALVDAINERRQRSDRDLTRRALQHLTVGTRVRLDEHVRPKYLQGAAGTIHQIDATTVVVSLDTPTGRYTDGHISCSPRVLHAIPEKGT
jgi:hypothetical protein